MPKDNGNPGSEKTKGEGFSDVSQAIIEAEKVRAIRDALSGGRGAEKTEEKTTVDIASIVNAQTNLTQTLITQLTDMVKNRPADPFVEHLKDEVTTVRQRLEGGADPMAVLLANMEVFDKLMDTVKTRLGIGQVQTQVSDIPRLLELEQMKFEHDERRHQWELEREDRKQQWEIENKQRERDYRLKLLEFTDSRKAKEKATDSFQDLIGSVVDSLETERAAVGEAATQESGTIKIPKAFKCLNCGHVIRVPRDQDLEVPIICDQCGQEHVLQELLGGK